LLPLEIDPLKTLIKGFSRDPLGYSIIKRAKKIRPNVNWGAVLSTAATYRRLKFTLSCQ